MEIEMWDIDRVKPYEKNPRMLRPDAVDAVAQSIVTYGFRQPIVTDPEGVVIIGHTRRLAALKLKLDKSRFTLRTFLTRNPGRCALPTIGWRNFPHGTTTCLLRK